MDFLKNISGDKNEAGEARVEHQATQEQSNTGGGGLMGKMNSALGGGQSGENKEDGLDKAVDFVQEHFLKSGDQSNESAIEQAKDEQISDAIRSQYKNATGKDFPIADK